MIVQSTFIWAKYLLPNSPYCMIYLWWDWKRKLKLISLGSERVNFNKIFLARCWTTGIFFSVMSYPHPALTIPPHPYQHPAPQPTHFEWQLLIFFWHYLIMTPTKASAYSDIFLINSSLCSRAKRCCNKQTVPNNELSTLKKKCMRQRNAKTYQPGKTTIYDC